MLLGTLFLNYVNSGNNKGIKVIVRHHLISKIIVNGYNYNVYILEFKWIGICNSNKNRFLSFFYKINIDRFCMQEIQDGSESI